MVDPRAQQALSRIERALQRIEAAADRPLDDAPSPDGEELARVREAHDRLRRRVIGAIGQIDDLIAVRERG